MSSKPTVADLETLLNSEDNTPVKINSDGSITELSAVSARPEDVILRELLDINRPKSEHEHLAVKVIEELWHFKVCPFDHCTRCIRQEKFIKLIRDTIPPWHQLNEP